MRRTKLVLLTLALFLLATGAFAQAIPFDLEVGYRWAEIDGNEDMYRTQINERSGVLIRSFSLTTGDDHATNFFDHVRIDVNDLGAGPAGALTIDARRADTYRLRLAYRSTDYYSALPALANPLLNRGIIPGQHTFDRERNVFDAELELLPGRAITPFVGFTYNNNSGPGLTTYSLGLDEFQLHQDLDDTDTEYRVGFGFNTKFAYGSVTQGWRDASADETFSLVEGGGAGNNPGNVLGRPITASAFSRTTSTESEAPFTNAYVTFTPVARLKVTGSYVVLNSDLEGDENETATGSFGSFAQSVFFSGLQEQTTSNANSDASRAGLRAEFAIAPGVDLFASWQDDQRDLSGTSLINTILFNAVNFSGVNIGELEELISSENSFDRERNSYDVGVAARALGPFSIRAAFRQTDEDVEVTPSLEEIVVPGAQGGSFERSIDTIDVNANFAKAGFLVGASYRNDSADDPILRTDFLDRDRLRVRAAYTTPGQMLRIGLSGEQTEQDNNREGIGYDATIDQLSADVEFAPMTMLRLRGSYSSFDSDSTITIRRPENFTLITSENNEEGESIEGGIGFVVKRFSIDAGLAQFENRGTNPFEMDRFRVRAVFDLFAHAGLAAEWDRDKYEEGAGSLGDYEADRFGLYLRFSR